MILSMMKMAMAWKALNSVHFRNASLLKMSPTATNLSKRFYAADYRESNIIKSRYNDITIPHQTLHDYIIERIKVFDQKVAMECCITGHKYTYSDVVKKSRNLNKALRHLLHLQPNDVVSIILPNVPEYPISVLAISMAGLVATPMNPAYTKGEMQTQLIDSDAKAVITLSSLEPIVQRALGTTKLPLILINSKAKSEAVHIYDFDELCLKEIDEIGDAKNIQPNNVVILPYSTGSTGFPKGVRLTHLNLLANIKQMKVFKIGKKATDSFQDVIPAFLPMFHIYGLMSVCLMSLLYGAKIITMPKFDPHIYLKLLREVKPTVLFVIPPIVIFLYKHNSVTPKHLKSVRIIVSGAAPLGGVDEHRLRQKVRPTTEIVQGYGLTETSPVVTFTPSGENKPGTAGVVLPNTEMKIMPLGEPNGRPLPHDRLGEIWVRGPQVMLGYLNRAMENKEAFHDGWLRTGDVGYYDREHFFYVIDRVKEMIKVNAYQVAPVEIEDMIRSFPGVEEVAVAGVPDSRYGEAPRAFIVVKKGSKFSPHSLNEYVNNNLAEYKQLKGGIELVESIPKSQNGKIQRKILREEYNKKHRK